MFFLNPAPAIIATPLKHKIVWIEADSAVQKAEAAAAKKAAEDQKKASEEEKQWTKGSKSSAKKYVNSISQGEHVLEYRADHFQSTERMLRLRKPRLPARRQSAMPYSPKKKPPNQPKPKAQTPRPHKRRLAASIFHSWMMLLQAARKNLLSAPLVSITH